MDRPAPDTTSFLQQLSPDCRADHQFIAMLDAYRGNGGLARKQEVLALFQGRGSDIATLTRWIDTRQVICFEWESILWLPLCQFNLIDMTPRPGLSQVLAELTAIYDHWALATWFAQPNPWLAQRTPADSLCADPSGVLHAARADRFIAEGRSQSERLN